MQVKQIASVMILLLVLSQHASAQTYKHQLGVRLGSIDQVVASGFSYRYFFKEGKAIEAMLSLNRPAAVGVLYQSFQPMQATKGLHWFYGAGIFAGFGSSTDIAGVTGVAGIDYQFTGDVPINLSVDWKPELTVFRTVRFRAATVGVSIRYAIK